MKLRQCALAYHVLIHDDYASLFGGYMFGVLGRFALRCGYGAILYFALHCAGHNFVASR